MHARRRGNRMRYAVIFWVMAVVGGQGGVAWAASGPGAQSATSQPTAQAKSPAAGTHPASVLGLAGSSAGTGLGATLPLKTHAGATPAQVTPADATAIPDVPMVTSVVATGLGVLVAYTPSPAAEDVTSYTVQLAPAAGGNTAPVGCTGPFTTTVDASNSAALVEGLCTGVAYAATVSAANAVGSSAFSAASLPIVPLAAQVPEAPVITSVLGRNRALVVSWSPPGMDGGEAISGYQLTLTAAQSVVTATAGPSATTATVSGLTNRVSYSVSLVAVNSVGSSEAATATGKPKASYVPGGPSEVTATPDGTGAVDVSWDPPIDDGGSSLTGYTVTWQEVAPGSGTSYVPAPGSSPQSLGTDGSAGALTIPASGFSPAAALYEVSVTAANAVGTGASQSTASPVSPVTTLSSNAVVLSGDTMAALASDTPSVIEKGSVLVWPAPAPAQISALTSGQVLLAAPAPAAPQGLLDLVQSVSSDSSGDYTITTAPAPLTDAFTTLALATTTNPLSEGAGVSSNARTLRPGDQFRPTVPGVRDVGSVGPNVSTGFSKTLTLSFNDSAETPGVGGSVSGELTVTPDLSLSLGLDTFLSFIPDGVHISASASIAASANITAEVQGSFSTDLGEIEGDPIDLQIGPFPLVIVPKVPLDLDVDGDGGIQVTATGTIGASLYWDTGSPGTLKSKNLTQAPVVNVTPAPGHTDNGNLVIDLSAQPQLDVFDTAGPNVEGDLILTATFTVNPPPGTPWLSLVPSVSISVGLDIDIDGFHESLEVQLATLTFPALQLFSQPVTLTISPPYPEVDPGQSVQLTATASDGSTGHTFTWSLEQQAGDTISTDGLFTAAGPTGRSVTVNVTDENDDEGTTTIGIGVGFDPPGDLQAVEDSGDTGVQVSWTPAADGDGLPVVSYIVDTSGGVPSQTIVGTSTSLPWLNAGTTYVITVYPVNSANQLGPAATTKVTIHARKSPGQIQPPPPQNPSALLQSVSCTSASNCMAVGYVQAPNQNDAVTLAGQWNGTAWTVVPTPAVGTSAVLNSVSCFAANSCIAVGGDVDSVTGTTDPLVMQWDGTSWTLAPAPTDTPPGSQLLNVTCTSASFCIAVGFWETTDATGSFPEVAEMWNGRAWTAQSLPLPTGAFGAQLFSVSCTSAKACTVVGGYQVESGGNSPFMSLADRWNGTTWTVENVPEPAGMITGGLTGVSCPTAKSCNAVGVWEFSNGQGGYTEQPLAAQWNGSTWTLTPIATPPAPGVVFPIFGVSCTSASKCTATGTVLDPGADSPVIEQWNGTAWQNVAVPVPSGSIESLLVGISCPTAHSCTAVGGTEVSNSGTFIPFILVVNE